ncbi:MAG: zinc ribbon domain-containing protein [Candidatus Heimdallarchaeota archaeon]|nr:zinc ribbon domain-containing protein [Candidatus Heimdallarchaeota archaeon]MCK4877872.1 zinc ribbon domain-containing protein [Candidatus Heimdallarchaeota archaeon]
MKSKALIYIILVSIGASIVFANAQVTTNTLFSDSDSLSGGYWIRYQYEVEHTDTTIRVDLDSSEPIDFGICDKDEMEDWQNGGSEPSWHVYRTNVTLNTITVTVNKGTYDFVLINWGISISYYDITVYESYDPSSTSFGDKMYIFIGIGVAVIAVIVIAAFVRSRRRREAPVQYQTQTTQVGPYQPFTQQTSEYQPPASEQTIFEAKPKGLQTCPNCGADEEISAKFCTNCGGKLNS